MRVLMPRYFTVAEANALLPLLRPHVRRLIDSWRRLNDVQAEVVALLERRPHDDLGGPPLSIAATAIIGAQSAIVAIQAYGAELKDPATGLLDFPAIRMAARCICAGATARSGSASGIRSTPVSPDGNRLRSKISDRATDTRFA